MWWATLAVLFQILLLLLGMFLIVVILLQRGRGGGLAGAFGGMGGQSAFGTRAGDVFTWITTGAAVIWVVLAGVSGIVLRAESERRAAELGEALPETPGMSAPGEVEESPFDLDLTTEEPAPGAESPGDASTASPADAAPAQEAPAAEESATPQSTDDSSDSEADREGSTKPDGVD